MTQSRPLLPIEGVLGILFGTLALFWPGLSALALPYIIAFWAILSGIVRIVMAIMLRRAIENEWSIALRGLKRTRQGQKLQQGPP